MSLFGALSASLTALNAQAAATNIVSNNISNLGTAGFKSSSSDFSTLIAGNVGGGVLQSVRNDIDLQGALNSTNIRTDLAVQGDGFFVVQSLSGETLYTRAGSFRTDNNGNLVNRAGYRLMGWPLDSSGRIPGESGNTTNQISNQLVESLEVVSEATISGRASPTTEISARINLDADADILEGAGADLDFTTGVNATNNSDTLIIPTNFAAGDIFTVALGDGNSFDFTYGGYEASNDIAGGIGGVTQENSSFTGFTDGDAFTISVNGGTAITYTFNSSSNTNQNQFRNLTELSQIINSTEGIRARISSGVMYIAGENANHSLAFADVASSGLVTAFGLSDVTGSGDTNRFATLGNLADAVNDNTNNPGISARLINASGNASLKIFNIDPTDTITYSDTITSAADTGQILTAFNLSATTYDEVYDPLGSGGSNMASGQVSADFNRSVTGYDSLGRPIDLRLAFVKITDNETEQTWAVELFAANPNDVTGAISASSDDGLLSYGTINFNGDGSLQAINGPISGEIDINPTGGATTQTITIDLGTVNDTDGLSQFAGGYNSDVDQDGFPTGQLSELQIDAEGIVTAIFDNSLTSQVYKLPLAYFPNENALSVNAGNAYTSNSNSGDPRFGQVGEAAVGTIVPGALENSTAEIGEQLTSLIIFQQGYSASTNVLRKVTELFEELRNL